MAYESPGTDIGTFTASADLSAKQFYIVKMSGDNTVTVCAAVTDVPIGVLQNTPASGEQAVVRVAGISKVSADATLAAGDIIGSSALWAPGVTLVVEFVVPGLAQGRYYHMQVAASEYGGVDDSTDFMITEV